MPRTLTIAAVLLGIVGLVATGVFLFFVAGLSSLPYLLPAFVALLGALYAALALLISTNVRRPAGRDPDVIGTAYGRRADDEEDVTKELSAVMERAAARQRTGPARTPDWFRDKPKVTVTKDET